MFSRLVEARQVITCVGRTRFWLGGGGPLPPGPPGLEAMAVVRSGAQGSARPSQDTRGPAYLQHGTLPWGHTSQPGPWTPHTPLLAQSQPTNMFHSNPGEYTDHIFTDWPQIWDQFRPSPGQAVGFGGRWCCQWAK